MLYTGGPAALAAERDVSTVDAQRWGWRMPRMRAPTGTTVVMTRW